MVMHLQSLIMFSFVKTEEKNTYDKASFIADPVGVSETDMNGVASAPLNDKHCPKNCLRSTICVTYGRLAEGLQSSAHQVHRSGEP